MYITTVVLAAVTPQYEPIATICCDGGRVSMRVVRQIVLIFFLILATSSATLADSDPLININRSVHGFNRTLDSHILKPVAETYATYTPPFVKTGIRNLFSNLGDVGVVVNDLLQLKFGQASSDAGRFLINTTVGLGGLFDVAGPVFGLQKHDEDFGQTLGYWSVATGAYVELPFFGPSTVRDSMGLVVDVLLDPLQFLENPAQETSLTAGEGVHDRAALLDAEGFISGDDYIFIREVYLQRREFLVRDGQVEDSFADFDSPFDDPDFEEQDLDDLGFDSPLATVND